MNITQEAAADELSPAEALEIVVTKRRQQQAIPRRGSKQAFVKFRSANVEPEGTVSLYFWVDGSTKFSSIRLRAVPVEQARQLHAALGKLLT